VAPRLRGHSQNPQRESLHNVGGVLARCIANGSHSVLFFPRRPRATGAKTWAQPVTLTLRTVVPRLRGHRQNPQRESLHNVGGVLARCIANGSHSVLCFPRRPRATGAKKTWSSPRAFGLRQASLTGNTYLPWPPGYEATVRTPRGRVSTTLGGFWPAALLTGLTRSCFFRGAPELRAPRPGRKCPSFFSVSRHPSTHTDTYVRTYAYRQTYVPTPAWAAKYLPTYTDVQTDVPTYRQTNVPTYRRTYTYLHMRTGLPEGPAGISALEADAPH